MRTVVSFILVFVISVSYRQSHNDCCQHHSCVCDFSVIHTEPWGRLSASSLLAFCFSSVCTAAWAKFTQVTSVSPTANNNNNNKTSQHPPLLFGKRRKGNKKAIHNRKSGGYAFFIGPVDLPHPRSQTKWKLTSRHPLTDRWVQPISVHVQTRLPRQAGGLSMYHCSVNKARGRVVFEDNGEAFGGGADSTVNSSSSGV